MLKSTLAAWRQYPVYVAAPLLAVLLALDKLYVDDPIISMLLATLYWGMLLVSLRVDKATGIIMTLGMPLYWWWYAHTDYNNRAQDIFGHVDYIKYIAENWLLPRPDRGWVSYHPPLYYAIAALFYKLTLWMELAKPFEFVRLLSVYSFLAFLVLAVKTFELAALKRGIYLFCLILVVFWPPGIMIASRVDSDLLLYPLCMACFYYLVRWHKALVPGDLQRSLLWLALAIITRSNAIVLAATIGGVVAYHLLKCHVTPGSFRQRRFVLCALCLVLAVSINMGRTAYVRAVYNANTPYIVGNAKTMTSIRVFKVTRAPENFLTFDFQRYYWPPFVDPQRDGSGRQNFWAMLFKTSLWGEFKYEAKQCAHWADLLLLLLACYTLFPVMVYTHKEYGERLPYLLLPFMSVAGLMVNRYQVPIMPSGDVRYVYFYIVPLAILFGYTLEMLEQRKQWALLYIAVTAAGTLLVLGDAVFLIEALVIPARQ